MTKLLEEENKKYTKNHKTQLHQAIKSR